MTHNVVIFFLFFLVALSAVHSVFGRQSTGVITDLETARRQSYKPGHDMLHEATLEIQNAR